MLFSDVFFFAARRVLSTTGALGNLTSPSFGVKKYACVCYY